MRTSPKHTKNAFDRLYLFETRQ